MDNLTAGMKKIKINVLTKEKKDEQARAEAQKKLALQQTSTEPSTSAQAAGQDTNELADVSNIVASHNEAPVTPGLNAPNQSDLLSTPQAPFTAPPVVSSMKVEEDNMIRLGRSASPTIKQEASSPVCNFRQKSPVTPVALAQSPVASEPDLFVPYQPEGPPGMSVPLSGPVQILEPNMGTPAQFERSVSENRQDLASPSPSKVSERINKLNGHHFTATSKLPFAQKGADPSRISSGARSPAGSKGEGK